MSTPLTSTGSGDPDSSLTSAIAGLARMMDKLNTRLDNLETKMVPSLVDPPRIPAVATPPIRDEDVDELDEVDVLTAWMDRRKSSRRQNDKDDLGYSGSKNRRKSMLTKIAEAADKPLRTFETVQSMPSFDHIVLKELTVTACIQFLNDVHRYQA
jgi:hypothetical protein